jgi:hypothetical protein
MSEKKAVGKKVATALGIACIILSASLVGTILFWNAENTNLQNHVDNLQDIISNLTPAITANTIETRLVQEHYYYYLNRTTNQTIGAQIICSGYMNGSLVVISPRNMHLHFYNIDLIMNNTDQMIDPRFLIDASIGSIEFWKDLVPGENLLNFTESQGADFNPNLQKLSNITSDVVTFPYGINVFRADLYDLPRIHIITSLNVSTPVFVTINPNSSESGGYE